MPNLNLDEVYVPLKNGTLEVQDFDVDVYESNSDTQPADETEMTLVQTLTADTVNEYGEAAKWILFKSVGAAIITENGMVKF